MKPLFGDYQYYFREQFKLPADCLNQLRPGQMVIQASVKPGSYITIFNDKKNTPYIKTVTVAGEFFESNGWRYDSFADFLAAHKADVAPVLLPSLNPVDPKWYLVREGFDTMQAAHLLKGKKSFVVTKVSFDHSQPYRVYFFHTGVSQGLLSVPFAIRGGEVISRDHPSTFNQLLSRHHLDGYKGINES